MVQRKRPKRIESQAELSGKDTSSRKDSGRNMKKLSPIKEASDSPPNYMKPTTNSGTRKQRLQVTQITRNSSKASSSLASSGIKPVKSLTTSSSLKPVRSSMKKSSGIGIYPMKNVSRATCSSTLKDAKFSRAVDLNPEITESEEPSKIKVCPYKRCSLHGHKHEPLAPLKCFLSARNQLVQNQKSMELKRMSSVIAISRIPSELSFNPLFEETHDDYFVRIYDYPQAQMRNLDDHVQNSIQGNNGVENPEVLNDSSLMENDWKYIANQIYESSQNEDYDDLELCSYPFNEDIDSLFDTLESMEFDWKLETKQDSPIIIPVHQRAEGTQCNMASVLHKYSEETAESDTNVLVVGSLPDRKADCSPILDDGFNPICGHLPYSENAGDGWSIKPDCSSFTSVIAEAGIKLKDEDVLDKIAATSPVTDGFDEGGYGKEVERDSSVSSQGYAETAMNTADFGCMQGSSQDTRDFGSIRTETEIKGHKTSSEDLIGLGNYNLSSDDQSDDSSIGSNQNMTENGTIGGCTAKTHKEDCLKFINALEINEKTCSDADKFFLTDSFSMSEGDEIINNPSPTSTKYLTKVSSKPKIRYGILRRKRNEDMEQRRAFNPRAPRYLPVEPETEADKVGLRHQPTDGRKNAEEWMIDYALQQAILKLAPDREKVELLVEAFETIICSLHVK